jgi:hypothetical protein
VPGQRGPAGSQGPKGTQGEPGNVGVTYIRWGKKTCPNTGATLVYEGNNPTVARSSLNEVGIKKTKMFLHLYFYCARICARIRGILMT